MKHTFAYRLRRGLRDCTLKPSFRLSLFEDGYHFSFFGFLIVLPFLDRWMREPRDMVESWGGYYYERCLWLCWGDRKKVIRMPWDLVHMKHEVLRPDGTWVKFVGCWEDKEPDGRWTASYPYRYTLKNGEVQERTATVYVDRREWRQRWLKWCPWFALKRQSIDVTFSDEVGERTGSWKGGCISTVWKMHPGESPEAALRRMERERKFD